RLLQKEAKKGFHPSSLNIYINCPLQFYLSRLIRVEESDDIEETIDARTMGIVIHEALRVIIGGHLRRPLDKGSFQQFKKMAEAEVKRQFGKYYHEDDISYGKNYLIVNVALNMLKQLFDREAAWLDDGKELFVTALEEGLSTSVQIKDQNNISQINFKGTIDRIDSKAGKVRILDYKTGGVVAAKLKPETWEVLFTDPEYSQALQLMMYAWLFHKNHTEVSELEAGIISLRAPGRGPVMMHPPDKRPVDTEVLEEFEDHLMGLLMEIVDPDIPFAQTEDESRCKYCSFKTICNKTVSNFSY
ncbi:MAG: PD-(D/E)XK nuclease family protein, partial [Bacteroidales bacterium]|nr:PD-(D/E)XK nuclease family protein [Bacteroidales bacterium]